MDRGFADLVIHEQHVLAPFDRFVAADEELMRLAAGEEAGLLEAVRITSLSPEKTRITPCSLQ